MSDTVVTRFAPSPTGFLHIGGARTALFNWLYARGRGGKMLLRIEDTDRSRSTREAIDAILEGLTWLGLGWDGEVVYQHARAGRHAEVAREMLEKGLAYRCYATREELERMRQQAHAEGRAAVYDGMWRDRDPSDAPAGVTPVIRFKAPKEGETAIEDRVQGTVTVANRDLDDLVIMRSDGTPTYNLAVVVDDHDMGVTHAIRGADHLTNAGRQAQIYAALGWEIPAFAHIPLIHGPDGAKLSKRHGALGVEAYRDMGYLPDALRNYLVRLGWSHGDEEIIPLERMIEWFDLDAVGRAPARFDFAKLENLNGHYIRNRDDAALVADVRALLPRLPPGKGFGAEPDAEGWRRFEAAIPHLKERAKTLLDLIDGARFLFAERPLDLDDKAAKMLDAAAGERLAGLLPALEAAEPWNASTLESVIRTHAEEAGVKLGQIAQPLRAALTGRAASPGIFDVLELLGRAESLARIRDRAGPERTEAE